MHGCRVSLGSCDRNCDGMLPMRRTAIHKGLVYSGCSMVRGFSVRDFLWSGPKPGSLMDLGFVRDMSEGRKFGERLLQPFQRELI